LNCGRDENGAENTFALIRPGRLILDLIERTPSEQLGIELEGVLGSIAVVTETPSLKDSIEYHIMTSYSNHPQGSHSLQSCLLHWRLAAPTQRLQDQVLPFEFTEVSLLCPWNKRFQFIASGIGKLYGHCFATGVTTKILWISQKRFLLSRNAFHFYDIALMNFKDPCCNSRLGRPDADSCAPWY
jgi:hypothetical protein